MSASTSSTGETAVPGRWISGPRESPKPPISTRCPRRPGSSRSPTAASSRTATPPRWQSSQRAVLILCEVLRWKAAEAAELLDTSVASINSALQRARATLADTDLAAIDQGAELDDETRALLERYLDAFERYDMEALTSLIHEDATQSMPPYDLWLRGRDDILHWWVGPGATCRNSHVVPTPAANGSPAFGQYRPKPGGEGYEPWALQVIEISAGRIVEFTFFLDTKRLFPLFGLPLEFRA